MELYQRNTSQKLQVTLEDDNGLPLHGATVVANVIRRSDGYQLDASNNVFVYTTTHLDVAMEEVGTTGLYEAIFNQAIADGGNVQDYTVIYKVLTPFQAITTESISFYDKFSAELKGEGWDAAYHKPTLMNMANKDNTYSFDPVRNSLEGISNTVDEILVTNYNTEAV